MLIGYNPVVIRKRNSRTGRFRFGIQDRIVLWLLVLGIAPAIITSLLGHWVMSQAAINAAGQHLLTLSERVAAGVDSEVRELTGGVNELATGSALIRTCVDQSSSPDSAATARRIKELSRSWADDSARLTRTLLDRPASRELKHFQQQNPGLYDRLLVTDLDGIVVGATEPPGRIHYSDQKWWQAAFNQGRGAPYLSRLCYEDNKTLLNIAAPVLDSARTRVVGIVRVLANAAELAELVEQVEVGQTGFATLTTKFGELLVSPLPGSAWSRIGSSDRLHHLTTNFPIWYQGRGLVGRTNAVVAVTPVPSSHSHGHTDAGGTGWVVTVEQNKAEILIATHQFGRSAIFVLLLAAAAVMVVGLFLSERIVRPLRDLRDGVRQIGSGSLNMRLGLRTGDEIEDLASEFDAMAGKLDESYRGLEEKISAATTELARKKDSLQAILTALGEGLMVVDMELRIVMWNRTAEKMTGFDAEEVIGQLCAGILRTGSESNPDVCGTACPARDCLASRQTLVGHDLTTYIITKTGTRLPVSFAVSPLFDEQNETRGCVVVLRDISREKEMDQLKSSMISTVSHELRAPLTPIVGFAEMLQGERVTPEKRKEFLKIIVREGHRLFRLVDDFLTLSRIEAGKFKLNLEQVDVRNIVEELISTESSQHPDHTLTSGIPEGFARFRADPERIKAVIQNLISNAIKYSPDGGPVRIHARDLGAEIEISVEDHGIGIRAEDIPKLFHRFQRVNREAAPGVSGTGLGLSICRSIVGEHGGTIRVDSRYREGSTFTVRLPRQGPGEDPATTAA